MEEEFTEQANLVIHIRNTERENNIQETPIILLTTSKTSNLIESRPDISTLVSCEKRPFKQNKLMSLIQS
jgi:hypothetical protein